MISSRQRLFLRKLGQTLPTKFQLGKDAIHSDWIRMIDMALTKQELIKLHILKSMHSEVTSFLPTLLKSLNAELVQTIGHRVILYRPHPTQPRIQLPR